MSSFKVYFSSENIRRFNTPSRLSFEDFISLLTKHYPAYYNPTAIRIQYMDNEGDRIEVTSELEWTEMFSQLQGQHPIKLYIFEKPTANKNNNSQDVPPCIPPAPIQNFPIPQFQGVEIGSNVTKCLAQFFPNGIILPFNIPNFLSRFVNVINVLGNTEVDLAVDVTGLGNAIHEKGMADLDHQLYKEASHAFSAQTILQPDNNIAFIISPVRRLYWAILLMHYLISIRLLN